MPKLALRVSKPFAKAFYRKVQQRRADGVRQGYWVKVEAVAVLPDDAPVGKTVRYRSADGRERDLLKVAEVPEWIQHFRRCPHRSVWYEVEGYHTDLTKHALLRDPRATARAILEGVDRAHTVLQENDHPRAVRFFRTIESLGGLVGEGGRLRYVKAVVYFSDSQQDYSFLKTLHPKRAILNDRRVLWP